jgi:CcmD family protein
MINNFWWVFASYSVVWVAMIVYLGRLFGRQKEVERQLAILEAERH